MVTSSCADGISAVEMDITMWAIIVILPFCSGYHLRLCNYLNTGFSLRIYSMLYRNESSSSRLETWGFDRWETFLDLRDLVSSFALIKKQKQYKKKTKAGPGPFLTAHFEYASLWPLHWKDLVSVMLKNTFNAALKVKWCTVLSFKLTIGKKCGKILQSQFINVFIHSQYLVVKRLPNINRWHHSHTLASSEILLQSGGSFASIKPGVLLFLNGFQRRIKTMPPQSTVSMRGNKSIITGFKRPEDQQTF